VKIIYAHTHIFYTRARALWEETLRFLFGFFVVVLHNFCLNSSSLPRERDISERPERGNARALAQKKRARKSREIQINIDDAWRTIQSSVFAATVFVLFFLFVVVRGGERTSSSSSSTSRDENQSRFQFFVFVFVFFFRCCCCVKRRSTTRTTTKPKIDSSSSSSSLVFFGRRFGRREKR